MEQKNKTKKGGRRIGAGRPKVEAGKRHTWIVPIDIEQLAQKYGTSYLWDAIRFKVKFDKIKIGSE